METDYASEKVSGGLGAIFRGVPHLLQCIIQLVWTIMTLRRWKICRCLCHSLQFAWNICLKNKFVPSLLLSLCKEQKFHIACFSDGSPFWARAQQCTQRIPEVSFTVHDLYLNFTCYYSTHSKASLKFSSVDNIFVFLFTLLINYYPILQIFNMDRKKLFESLMVLPQKIFSTANLKRRDIKVPKHLTQ